MFIERKPENLRIFRLSLFTGEDWAAKLLARVQSLQARLLPCGELPQQRLRGHEIGVTQKILERSDLDFLFGAHLLWGY